MASAITLIAPVTTAHGAGTGFSLLPKLLAVPLKHIFDIGAATHHDTVAEVAHVTAQENGFGQFSTSI